VHGAGPVMAALKEHGLMVEHKVKTAKGSGAPNGKGAGPPAASALAAVAPNQTRV